MKQTRLVALSVLGAVITTGLGFWGGSVYQSKRQASAAPSSASLSAPGTTSEARILYYRNPMGLPDTSPTPKKDPMGMDYIPVYEGAANGAPGSDAGSAMQISPDKVQKLGVKTELVQARSLGRSFRAAGRIQADERRLYAISAKFEGYVERLHANVTGQFIGKGQALLDVYSPELVSAQREYLTALQGAKVLSSADPQAQSSLAQLAQASLTRLRNWDISETQIQALAQSSAPKRSLSFHSPYSGIITEKLATQGMRFMPGDTLFKVADLSKVWVIADVFEQDIRWVRTGVQATVKINAYPDRVFSGPITYVYPQLNAETRTIPIRIELNNEGQVLKPGMFAQVEWSATSQTPALSVPLSAVIDSGTRRIVWVQSQPGRFEAREVQTGDRNDRHVQVTQGLREGESVVVAANFLIDAESNLQAAVSGLGPSPSPSPSQVQATAGSSHQGQGQVQSIDAKAGTVTIQHGPIASLKWPQMSMEFDVTHSGLLGAVRTGTVVNFTFIERAPGEWVITQMTPATSPQTKTHANH